MKELIGLFSFVMFASTAIGQYYYKDIIVSKETTEKWKDYKESNVKSINISSFEGNGQPTEGFIGKISIAGDFSQISTYTRSDENQASTLIAKYNAQGLLINTVDTSDRFESITQYIYDDQGHVTSIMNSSLETDNQVKESEEHIWKYDQNGIPQVMLKVKENRDTAYVRFIADGKGNITEEREVHNQDSLPAIYYYYDDQNRLTDVVRYNERAKRLLPDYIFDYGNKSRITSMLVVPEGNDYQKWIYEYNDRGLKDRETCYGKGKELLGRIEYEYNYAK